MCRHCGVCGTRRCHRQASRVVPIFPEIRKYLEKAWEQADDGAIEVVPRCQSGAVNLRTRLLAIIEQAGLSPWPKLFQNLRSSRETELVESFPVHAVCSLIGNTPKVASEHYLQVTDDHVKGGVVQLAQCWFSVTSNGSGSPPAKVVVCNFGRCTAMAVPNLPNVCHAISNAYKKIFQTHEKMVPRVSVCKRFGRFGVCIFLPCFPALTLPNLCNFQGSARFGIGTKVRHF